MRVHSDNRPLISVIVPVFKVEAYLDQCVKNVVGQTYDNLEIILVDDGSPDVCGAMCDEWTVRDERIRVVHKTNGGLSSARNAGIEICKGEYLSFVDSDDWLEPDTLRLMLDVMEDQEVDCCSVSFNLYSEIEGITIPRPREYFKGDSEETLILLYQDSKFPIFAPGKLYRTALWGDIRFPKGHLYEDAFTLYKYIDRARKSVLLPECMLNYRQRPDSIMASGFSLRRLDRQQAWKENYDFCKERYPKAAEYARIYWLEHIPSLLSEFPEEMTSEEREEKRRLKKAILTNLPFFATHTNPKKTFHQLAALLS